MSLRPSERTDWLLCAELALMGPIIHVDERLANRTRAYPSASIEPRSGVGSIPLRAEQLRTSPRRLYRELYALAVSADLSEAQLRRCRWALRRFWIKEAIRPGPLTSLGRAASNAPTLSGRESAPVHGRSDSSTRRSQASRQKG